MTMLLSLFGGIGLFLLGMILMTDGLKTLAGDALKSVLGRFTRGTFSAILSGAGITALIQSSSATTFMTIGFVSAGLLTFTQSIGVIIGANIGSTSTGWIVSLIGFKVNMDILALPLIGLGVVLQIAQPVRFGAYGKALSGFGLLFLGIVVAQDSMSQFATQIDLSGIQGDVWCQLLVLAGIGFVMTVVLQSSSAAVVITLTALQTGTIAFDQAAALVIGQNVGTTLKALLAAAGASTAAKQTSLVHILFNVITAMVAFLLLPLLIKLVWLMGDILQLSGDEATLLALFHTVFNLVGMFIFIPLIRPVAALLQRVIPEKGNHLIRYLDDSVAEVMPLAIDAAKRTLINVNREVILELKRSLSSSSQTDIAVLERAQEAVDRTRQFLSKINHGSEADTAKYYHQQLSIVHALDHLDRLIRAAKEKTSFLTEGQHALKPESIKMKKLLMEMFSAVLNEADQSTNLAELASFSKRHSLALAELRRRQRSALLEQVVSQPVEMQRIFDQIQDLLWVDRLAYHLWRVIHHLYHSEESLPDKNESISDELEHA